MATKPKHTPIQTGVIGSNLDAKLFHTYARLVMAAWKHDFQFTDWLTQDGLVALIGLDWSNIKRHTTELRRAGLVDWKTDGKNGRRFFILEVRLEEGAKAQSCAPSSSNSINSSSEETPTTSEGANLRPGINVIDTESRDLLRGLGLGEPRRSQVADLPNCTPQAINAHAAKMRAEGYAFPADVALLAWRIEHDWPVPILCAQCCGLDGEHADDCPTQVERCAREAEAAAERDRRAEEWRGLASERPSIPQYESIRCQDGGTRPADQVFQLVLGELELQLTSSTFATWLGRARLVEYDAGRGVFVVGVHNGFAKDWLENRLAGMINQTLTRIIGIPTEARFVVSNRELDPRDGGPLVQPALAPVELAQGE